MNAQRERYLFKAFDNFCFGGSILYRAAVLSLFRHTDNLVNFVSDRGPQRSSRAKEVSGGENNCQFTPQNFSRRPSFSLYTQQIYIYPSTFPNDLRLK